MIRFFSISVCFFLLLQVSPEMLNAQDHSSSRKMNIGFLVEANKPLAGFAENYNPGFGVSILLHYTLVKEAQLTLSAGYTHFPGISSEDEYFIYNVPDWGVLPIRLGGKYYVTPHFFLKAETGAAFFLEPGRGTAFILGPGAGLQLGHFDAALKLETWTDGGTVSFAGFSLGYFF